MFKTAAALSVLSLILIPTAHAVTVKNLDGADHAFTVVEGASSQDLSLKPGATVDGICLKGCLIKLSGDQDTYELEGGEVTSIEDGVLWGDDVNPPPTTGEAPPSASPPKSP